MSDDDEVTEASSPADAHGMGVGRTASFSDGLFAIAMTLLVLSIEVPKGRTSGELWDSIRAMGPELFGFALSFAVIGRYWIAHHVFMRMIQRVTGGFLALTLLFLGVVAFVSIPTEVLGDTSSDTNAFAGAAVFYAISLGTLGVTFALLEWFSLHKDLVYAQDRATMRANAIQSLVPPTVFFVSIPLALAGYGRAAAWSWLLMIPLSMVVNRISERGIRRAA